MITGKELTAHFIMWQTNPDTLAMYFDMPPAAPDAGGMVAFDIRSDVGGELYAIGLDIKDAGVITRIVFGRAQVSDTGDVSFQRGAAIGWEVTLSAMDEAGVLAHLMSGPEVTLPLASGARSASSPSAA
jgi:hypothetical protein